LLTTTSYIYIRMCVRATVADRKKMTTKTKPFCSLCDGHGDDHRQRSKMDHFDNLDKYVSKFVDPFFFSASASSSKYENDFLTQELRRSEQSRIEIESKYEQLKSQHLGLQFHCEQIEATNKELLLFHLPDKQIKQINKELKHQIKHSQQLETKNQELMIQVIQLQQHRNQIEANNHQLKDQFNDLQKRFDEIQEKNQEFILQINNFQQQENQLKEIQQRYEQINDKNQQLIIQHQIDQQHSKQIQDKYQQLTIQFNNNDQRTNQTFTTIRTTKTRITYSNDLCRTTSDSTQ